MNRLYMPTVFILIFFVIVGCARYERKVVPFKMPEAFKNVTEAGGATIAAQAYNRKEAKNAFGFDIVGSGVLPVQVIFDNRGSHRLKIIDSRTYLVDTENNIWPILDQEMAYDRIAKGSEDGEILPEGVRSGFLAAAAGAVIGAAIGIVTGTNIGEALGKGAALGAATGVTLGGAKGMDSTDVSHQISRDLQSRSLQRRPVPSGDISHGFIFFPGEAKEQAKELRLAIKEIDTGVIHKLVMNF